LIDTIGAEQQDGPEEALLDSAFVLFIHGPANVKMEAKKERGEPPEESVDNFAWSDTFSRVEAPAEDAHSEAIEDSRDAEEERAEAELAGEVSFAEEGEHRNSGDEKGREKDQVVILEAGPPIDEPTDEWGEEPGPQYEMDITDRASLIERKSNQDGAGGDGKTKYSALTSKEKS
jgi:hypothetical protein